MKHITQTVDRNFIIEMRRGEWLALVYLQQALNGHDRLGLSFGAGDPEIDMDFTDALERIKYWACMKMQINGLKDILEEANRLFETNGEDVNKK